MSERSLTELKADAMLAELTRQRNEAQNRCVALMGEIALAQAEVEQLKKLLPKPESEKKDA